MREIELWRTSMLADVGATEPIGPVMRSALSLAISAVFETEGVEQFVDDKPTLQQGAEPYRRGPDNLGRSKAAGYELAVSIASKTHLHHSATAFPPALSPDADATAGRFSRRHSPAA